MFIGFINDSFRNAFLVQSNKSFSRKFIEWSCLWALWKMLFATLQLQFGIGFEKVDFQQWELAFNSILNSTPRRIQASLVNSFSEFQFYIFKLTFCPITWSSFQRRIWVIFEGGPTTSSCQNSIPSCRNFFLPVGPCVLPSCSTKLFCQAVLFC